MTQLIRRVVGCVRERRLPWRVEQLLLAAQRRLEVWPPTERALRHRRHARLVRSLESRKLGTSWSALPACPSELTDAGGVQVGHCLFVVRGHGRLGQVNPRLFVFDMSARRWLPSREAPDRLAHSQAAICSDGTRVLYAVSGQLGPRCAPAIADGFAYDTHTGEWRPLPPLPAPRYAGTMQLLHGRLHFVGGACPDRSTPSAEHWSLAVAEGVATEADWRPEPPIPLPAMHRGSAVINGDWYVVGGQHGDFVPVPGDATYPCTERTREQYFPDVYRFRASQWCRVADLPVPVSHTNFSVVADGSQLHVVGGQMFKDDHSFRLRLTDVVQSYDVASDHWRISARYPYRVKRTVCGLHDGQLYGITGQRDQGSHSDAPGAVIDEGWHAAIPAAQDASVDGATVAPLSHLAGKQVALITHELTMTGAPLILFEAAAAMRDAGATVRLFSMADDATYGNPAEREGLAVLPIETAMAWAAQSDLVVANTCVAGPWVRDYLVKHPRGAERLLWWIHENSPEEFAHYLPGTDAVRQVAYDSHDERDAWAPFNIGASSRRFVLHPGNRTDLLKAAHAPRLPWPGTAHRVIEPVHELVDRATARHRLGVSDDTFLLCCTGTIQPRKGQLWLVETVARLLAHDPSLPVRVLLVGFFDEARRRATLSELKGTARTAVGDGRLLINHTPDVSVFLRASDAFVMNSQGRGEPFGRVTIEAMAFGLPVLGTSAGGTTEIVVDGVTGLLHPVGEAGLEALGANIVRLARDRSLARQLGQAGQQRADDHFTATRVYRELGHVVEVIIGEAPAADPGAPPDCLAHR